MVVQQSQANQMTNKTDANPSKAVVTLSDYIQNIKQMNNKTAIEYEKRLRTFAHFVMSRYRYSVDTLIYKLTTTTTTNQEINPYEVLSGYVTYLNRIETISSSTIKQRVITAKNFLEYHDVEISPRKFKMKVKLPKVVRRSKEAVSKEDIIDIINACSDIRLKTYVILLAATGMRATEALSTRVCDYSLETNPLPRVFVRGEYTKTKCDRFVFLTQETVKQLKNWLEFKYRTRRVVYYDKTAGKYKSDYRTPIRDDKDLMFSVNPSPNRDSSMVSPYSLYSELIETFGKTLDRMGRGEREGLPYSKSSRRKITFHTFRRYVKSTISDLGYGDFSEYFIGHIGSTYYRKTDKEKTELFLKIEPYLTFLDFAALERKGADTQTKIEELEATNQMLRQKDSMNTDAIAGLSDQLTKVMQEIEVLKKLK
jgi:integrase